LQIRIQFPSQGFDNQKLKKEKASSALKRGHPALQNIKILYFSLYLWVIFSLLNPNPDPDPETQTNPDPDPQPCYYKCDD
jgi:hypothetical protein